MTHGLSIIRSDVPLVLSMPHSGTDLLDVEPSLVSPWLARKDADWWIPELYDFAASLGATIVRTSISRTVIDVNRDPSGRSLYPGMAGTDLCPLTTFDGERLYLARAEPAPREVAERRERWFQPYHDALRAEVERLRDLHGRVVLYDCHSIRSVIPRLFEGTLPQLNVGTNGGRSCDASLSRAVMRVCAASGFTHVLDGRFKGGYITRHFGDPERGVHAIQMELACRTYMREPAEVNEENWPPPLDREVAEPLRETLIAVLRALL